VGIEDKIFPAEVKPRGPVPKGPGGEAGSPMRHQVEGHVAGTCARTHQDRPGGKYMHQKPKTECADTQCTRMPTYKRSCNV